MAEDLTICVRPLEPSDKDVVERLLLRAWQATEFVTCGRLVDARGLPGFLALRGGEPVGLLTYAVTDQECELLTLNAFHQFQGIGTALMEAFLVDISKMNLNRVFLITTNDNVDGIRFYQKRGWRLAGVNLGAVDRARETLKPQIPLLGHYDIPLRDEIVFELDPKTV